MHAVSGRDSCPAPSQALPWLGQQAGSGRPRPPAAARMLPSRAVLTGSHGGRGGRRRLPRPPGEYRRPLTAPGGVITTMILGWRPPAGPIIV
jgi:hypothetical protein